MWQARLYYDTGFNSINVPDSEETLIASSGNIKTFSTMDILQRYFLSKITIRAFEDDVINADYLKIYDENNENKYAFYSINGYNMTSGDVVELTVIMDPLLSCGGIENIEFLDGMTRRHHVSDDTFGAYQEDDPLLVPTRVYCGQVASFMTDVSDMCLIILSNYEIYGNSQIECNINRHLNVIADGDNYQIDSSNDDVPLFNITPNHIPESGTVVEMYNNFGAYFTGGNTYFNNYGDIYHIFDCSEWSATEEGDTGLTQFMGKVKELIEYGRSDVIKKAYLVPKNYMASQGYPNDTGWESPSSYKGPYGSVVTNRENDVIFSNKNMSIPSQYNKWSKGVYTRQFPLDFRKSGIITDVNNNRVLYGKHFAYTFMSPTSGEKCIINPELIKPSTVEIDGEPTTAPEIRYTVDIRDNGKPIFYIPTYGDDNTELPDTDGFSVRYDRIPKNKINGSVWPTINISIAASRGLELNRAMYNLTGESSSLQSTMQMYHDINPAGDVGVINAIPTALEMINNATKHTFVSNERDVLNSYAGAQDRMGYTTPILTSATISDAMSGNTLALNIANREIEKSNERAKYISSNLPQVEVLSTSSGDGLTIGNGLLVYRNYIDRNDAMKFDQILNQFGYKITEPIKKEFMNNRERYNYIEANGVSVSVNNIPKAVRDDLASLFRTGVRIWHTKPDNNYLQENKIKEVNNND